MHDARRRFQKRRLVSPASEVARLGDSGVPWDLHSSSHALKGHRKMFNVIVAWAGRRHDFVTSRSRRHESELSPSLVPFDISPRIKDMMMM